MPEDDIDFEEEEDEISPEEEGFMEGYEEGNRLVECPACGKVLVGERIFEREISGKHYRFCSESCCEKYLKKH